MYSAAIAIVIYPDAITSEVAVSLFSLSIGE